MRTQIHVLIGIYALGFLIGLIGAGVLDFFQRTWTMNSYNRTLILDQLKEAFKEATLTLAESKPDIPSDDILALAHIRFAIDLLEQDSQTKGATS